MNAKVVSYIALGSNMRDPVRQILQAIIEINSLPQCCLIKASSLYRSPAIGPPQDDIINAVVAIQTSLPAEQLLDYLQELEQQHQRVRTIHWGPRTLDCDMLLYGNEIIHTEHLIIPHPRMFERNFVLLPLEEIAPDLILPDGELLADKIKKSDKNFMYPLTIVE